MAEERELVALDLFGLVLQLGAYESGRYFYLKEGDGSSTQQKDGSTGLHAEHRFWDEVHRRLEPLQAYWTAFRENLFETGAAYVDDKGKPQLNLRARLTPTQVRMYDHLNHLVAHTDLEVVLQ